MAPKDNSYIEIAHQRAAEKKTHVSFPQLKYPSLRDNGLRSPQQWLKGKAMDDGAEGLWRVYDKLYDLTDFVKKHPGGPEWLELTKGIDITEELESHHLYVQVEKMLEKYYVRDAKTPRNSPFTFKEDGFYRTLKREVQEEIKKIPKNVTKRASNIIDGLFITLLISSVLSCWCKDYWTAMFCYFTASFSLAWMTVAAHSYLHKKTNWRMYLFNFSLMSYREFRISHVLSHHMFPNTLMDLEISTFEPLMNWLPRRHKKIHAKFVLGTELILFPFLCFLAYIKRFAIINSVSEGKGYEERYYWHDFIGLLLPIWMWLLSGCTAAEAFVMWLWITCTASLIFFTIGVNAAHHHPKVFKDGDQVRDQNLDWGIHELEAVMDRTDINGNLFKAMTFFGDHALHHLFPTLDHAVLPYLYPVLLDNCQKFKARFRMTSSLDLFLGQFRMAWKEDPTLLDEN